MATRNPISLKEDDALREREKAKQVAAAGGGLFRGGAERLRNELLTEEREKLVRESQERFRSRVLEGDGTYYRASDVSLAVCCAARCVVAASSVTVATAWFRAAYQEHVKPMFSVTWGPMLAVFSVNLEVTREPVVIEMCLRGFRQAIHISAQHRMETERDAFVTSLAKFTFLDSIRDIQNKNIDCIKTLIAVALNEGNHLRQSWGPVLNCVSQLARLQLFAQGGMSDDAFFPVAQEEPVSAQPWTCYPAACPCDHRALCVARTHPQRRKSTTRSGFNIFARRSSEASGSRRASSSTAGRPRAGSRRNSLERERLHAEAVAAAVGELAIDRVFHASVRLNRLVAARVGGWCRMS